MTRSKAARKAAGGDANVAAGTANRCAGGWRLLAEHMAASVAPVSQSMLHHRVARTDARQAPTNRPPLRGQPATIPDRRFFRIRRFSPVAEGVGDRSIA